MVMLGDFMLKNEQLRRENYPYLTENQFSKNEMWSVRQIITMIHVKYVQKDIFRFELKLSSY